jgi:Kef-type K+ transport system membrane component KefB
VPSPARPLYLARVLTDPFASIPSDLIYVALLFALFVVPKALQRYRIPSAITSLLMGVGASALDLFAHNDTIQLLSTFGIVALFLFAGLEINGAELRRGVRVLMQHGALWLVLTTVIAVAVVKLFDLSSRAATITALAVTTPSTGFILSSLPSFGLTEFERFSVKTKAVAAELLALGALFFVLQSESLEQFGIATAAMLAIVLFIPLAFRFFASVVAPYAPRSEFAFLLMVAVVCAYATRRLGVYYLVGAFIVGVAAQRFRARLPAMSSEKMVDALEAFGSVFIPFYFFNAGSHIEPRELGWSAAALGLVLLVVCVPLRVAVTIAHRRFALGEATAQARRVGVAMVPTLVFTLVLSEILRDRFGGSVTLVGALIIYTVINTMIPAFALGTPPPEFDAVHASEVVPVPTASLDSSKPSL